MDNATYTCETGFRQEGPHRTLVCSEHAHWEGDEITCKGRYSALYSRQTIICRISYVSETFVYSFHTQLIQVLRVISTDLRCIRGENVVILRSRVVTLLLLRQDQNEANTTNERTRPRENDGEKPHRGETR